jgi:hypothetical protein
MAMQMVLMMEMGLVRSSADLMAMQMGRMMETN